MQRCAFRLAPSWGLATVLLLGLSAIASSAFAQAQRNFPATALRGEIVVVQPPEIALNGIPARLAPGARIRGVDNMMLMSGAVVGQKLTVHYTRDTSGHVLDVWLLTTAELARKPWPTTAAEAAAWRFNADTQTWSRP
jgi:hypothetical protein